jgi:integrase/recombinase XerD
VTTLIQRMREDLVRRNYAESTIRSYLHTVEDFRRYAQKRLDHLGPDDIRRYQVYLREERKLDIGTASNYVAALRFLYVKTLKRPYLKDDLPYPLGAKHKRRLPTILSQEEVSRLIDSSKNLFHYAMLLTIYSAGLRRSELCGLKVANIDSQRMMLRIERGKGDVDREVPISRKLVETLREYWRWMRPQTYMFPGTVDGWRADKPITSKVVWEAVQYATRKAGIEKRVSPHTLRHCFATHMLEGGADLRTIQVLMGHKDIEATARYLHVSTRRLQAATGPLDKIVVAGPTQRQRSRRLHKPE